MIAYSRLSCNLRADLGGKSYVDMVLLECPPTNLINTIKAVGGFGVAIIIPVLSSWLSTFLFTRSKWLSYLRGERRHLKHFVVYYNTEEVTDHSGRMMSLVGGSKFGKPEKEN